MAGTVQDRPPDARTEIVNLISDGARVASEHIGRGTHTGPFVTPAGTIPSSAACVRAADRGVLRDA